MLKINLGFGHKSGELQALLTSLLLCGAASREAKGSFTLVEYEILTSHRLGAPESGAYRRDLICNFCVLRIQITLRDADDAILAGTACGRSVCPAASKAERNNLGQKSWRLDKCVVRQARQRSCALSNLPSLRNKTCNKSGQSLAQRFID